MNALGLVCILVAFMAAAVVVVITWAGGPDQNGPGD